MGIALVAFCVFSIAAAGHAAAVRHDTGADSSLRHTHRPHGLRPARGLLASASSPTRLFAPDSVWNQRLSNTAALDSSSPVLAGGVSTEVAAEEKEGIGPWISTDAVIYTVGPNQPTVVVQLDRPTEWWRKALESAFEAVPIPANAQPGSDADSEMTVLQPSTDRLWEFFKLRRESDGWHAAWGGAIQNVSQDPGYYSSAAWPGALPVWGATASSLPHPAGVITLRDITSGRIDHALAINLPRTRKGVWTWPAQRTDGINTDPESLPEGAHLRINPHVDLTKLNLPPLTLMIAKAAQRYGMIVRDQTEHAIGLWIQAPQPGGYDPFWDNGKPRVNGPFHGLWPNQLMTSFPWSAVQVLKMDLQGPATP